jgi:putative tricarboxylic transport membrane protein
MASSLTISCGPWWAASSHRHRLPLTFKLDPTGAIIMFAGIYFGGMYGSSTTSILINTPGEAASIATAIEGYKMALRTGAPGPALATAAIGSFVAGTIATFAAAAAGADPSTSRCSSGPWDYFMLMVLAFVTVSATFGSSVLRGMTSLALGLFLGLIGIDKLSGQARLTYDVPALMDGISITTLAVGLFAMGEALFVRFPLTNAVEQHSNG